MRSAVSALKTIGLGTLIATLVLAAALPQSLAERGTYEQAAANFRAAQPPSRGRIRGDKSISGGKRICSHWLFALDQFGKLKELAAPILSSWGLSAVTHPDNGLSLWIPEGLGLKETREKNGLSFRTSDSTLMIIFLRLDSDSVSDGYDDMKKMLVDHRYLLDYNVVSSDFFVISTVNIKEGGYGGQRATVLSENSQINSDRERQGRQKRRCYERDEKIISIGLLNLWGPDFGSF